MDGQATGRTQSDPARTPNQSLNPPGGRGHHVELDARWPGGSTERELEGGLARPLGGLAQLL